MKKHFYIKFKQKLWLYLGATALIIILLSASIVNLLGIMQVANIVSANEILDTIATVVMLIVVALIIIFVFGSGYSMYKNFFHLHFGFFVTVVNYSDILLIRTNTTKTFIILYIKTDKENSDYIDEESGIKADLMPINIRSIDVDAFINMIKSGKPDVVVEIIPEAVIK